MDRRANSEMLLIARKSRALTQEELAERANISQGHLSKYETGEHEIPHTQIAKVASALGYPESFFFQTEELAGLGPSVLYHRRKQRLKRRKLQQIEALVNAWSVQLRSLLDKCDIDTDYEFPQYDIEKYRHETAGIAELVRAQWRLPMGQPQPLPLSPLLPDTHPRRYRCRPAKRSVA